MRKTKGQRLQNNVNQNKKGLVKLINYFFNVCKTLKGVHLKMSLLLFNLLVVMGNKLFYDFHCFAMVVVIYLKLKL